METAIENVVDSLAVTIPPGLRAAFSDVERGVGAFDDFTTAPYGDTPATGGAGQPYWHDQDITDDVSAVQAALQSVVDRPRG